MNLEHLTLHKILKNKTSLMMIFLLTLFLTTNAQAFKLNSSQEKLALQIYKIGKTFKTADGMSIENTLTAISLRESSLGRYIVGDKLKNGNFKPIEEMSLGAFQIRLGTAKDVIRINRLYKYTYLLKDDSKLVNRLLTDVEFSAVIAAHYFITNYNEALRRDMWNPYFRAVSRHNGGWTNKKYYRVFIKDMNRIKKINFEDKIY